VTITPSTLTRAAAVATASAGLLFILIQPLHPAEDLDAVMSSIWAIVHTMSLTMAILGLAGITGIYLRQVREFGVLGLVGYLLFALFFLMQAVFTFAEVFIAPLTAAGSPDFTLDFVGLFVAGHVAVTDLGLLAAAVPIGSVAYLAGGVLFGVAIIRARKLPRWTGILLIVGAAASLAAAVLPHAQARLAAIPMGLALASLGYALWSEQRKAASSSAQRSQLTIPSVS
jgi:hypothetical protein